VLQKILELKEKTADPTVYGLSQVAGLGFEPKTSGL